MVTLIPCSLVCSLFRKCQCFTKSLGLSSFIHFFAAVTFGAILSWGSTTHLIFVACSSFRLPALEPFRFKRNTLLLKEILRNVTPRKRLRLPWACRHPHQEILQNTMWRSLKACRNADAEIFSAEEPVLKSGKIKRLQKRSGTLPHVIKHKKTHTTSFLSFHAKELLARLHPRQYVSGTASCHTFSQLHKWVSFSVGVAYSTE